MEKAEICDNLWQSEKKQIGVIFGKFYPVHTGHINMIYQAFAQVDELHVVVCSDSKRDLSLYQQSKMPKMPTAKDRVRWVRQIFQSHPQIIVHHLCEDGITAYPNGWADWATRVETLFTTQQFTPSVVFTSEPQDQAPYRQYLQLDVVLVDPQREIFNVSATKIRTNPYRYWQFIPQQVRPFFTHKIAIVGATHSGKTTLAAKLAATFNTTMIADCRNEFITQQLANHPEMLQYSDYSQIAREYQHRVEQAAACANKVVFLDTDLITMQAHCLSEGGKEDLFIKTMIEEYPVDFTILLKNNIAPTVAQTTQHAQLKALLENYHHPYIELVFNDYLSRDQQAQKIVAHILNDELIARSSG